MGVSVISPSKYNAYLILHKVFPYIQNNIINIKKESCIEVLDQRKFFSELVEHVSAQWRGDQQPLRGIQLQI